MILSTYVTLWSYLERVVLAAMSGELGHQLRNLSIDEHLCYHTSSVIEAIYKGLFVTKPVIRMPTTTLLFRVPLL